MGASIRQRLAIRAILILDSDCPTASHGQSSGSSVRLQRLEGTFEGPGCAKSNDSAKFPLGEWDRDRPSCRPFAEINRRRSTATEQYRVPWLVQYLPCHGVIRSPVKLSGRDAVSSAHTPCKVKSNGSGISWAAFVDMLQRN